MIITNLLTNMVVLGLFDQIPTNTPAFQAYVRSAMISNVQHVASQWRLNSELMRTNRVTQFVAHAYPEGYGAMIEFSCRYMFDVDKGDWHGFTDEDYSQGSAFTYTNGEWWVQYTAKHKDEDWTQHTAEGRRLWIAGLEGDNRRNEAVAERWAAAANLLTLRKARRIAESAARSLGVPIDIPASWRASKFRWEVRAQQMVWEEPSLHTFLPPGAVTTRATKHGLIVWQTDWEGVPGVIFLPPEAMATGSAKRGPKLRLLQGFLKTLERY